MENIFASLLLGHLTSDYLLQTNKMAIRKSRPGWEGSFWCFLHCLIYTAVIMLFLQTANPLVALIIFLSHYPIDRWSLGGKWLKFIGSRDYMTEFSSTDQYRDLHLSFSVLVYVVADNTLHLLLMWFSLKWLLAP
ncbi:MAG: DUF3307 domain-containing protein [Candidatus Buchananbacteria bacterium]|jgi:hypothetical protein